MYLFISMHTCTYENVWPHLLQVFYTVTYLGQHVKFEMVKLSIPVLCLHSVTF